MKTARLFLLTKFILLLQISLIAQVQWYQNQDGNNQPPNGTSATSVQKFTSSTFVACYQWNTESENSTWKISKTNFNGAETKTFFVTGPGSMVEMRVGQGNSLFVLQRNFPSIGDPQYVLYRLDENLHIKAQKTLSFSNNYVVYNLNCFEVDVNNNVFLAGDGQYPLNGNPEPASFIMKMDKNFGVTWNKMKYAQTSYSRLHVDNAGKVTLIEDYYTFFPTVYIKRISSNGQHMQTTSIATDPNRFTLYSTLDADENLLLYGGKTIGDTAQGIYLYKISRNTGNVVYEKTHFVSAGTQLNDLKVDSRGKIFSLVTVYQGSEQLTHISRINPTNGSLIWDHALNYSDDSCNLIRLAISNDESFYAIGQQNSNTFFAKGFAVKMKKTGFCQGNIAGPDSINYSRIHWLSDGIIDNNNRLVSIGGTYSFDPNTYEMTDVRAFAVKFGENSSCEKGGAESSAAAGSTMNDGLEEENDVKVSIFPNPVSDQMTVSNIQMAGYDRIAIYNLQGALISTHTTTRNTLSLDMNSLSNGIYMLVLRSSATQKEKSIKFVVRK